MSTPFEPDITQIAPAIAAGITSRLAGLRQEHHVAIPLAVESGSRAWGFPSPDSDYDARFVFVRRLDDYLSPWARRDVIEIPLEGEYDVNGWELGKALKLMLKGNAVILEWLQSPIVYEMDRQFRDEFLALAQRHSDRRSVGLHYLHLGERQWRTYFADGQGEVAIKKVFYALRPAAALRWIARHEDAVVPPMNFTVLMDASDPPAHIRRYVSELMERKAITRELGQAPLAAELSEFITGEYEQARQWLPGLQVPVRRDAHEETEAFFRATVKRLSPGI